MASAVIAIVGLVAADVGRREQKSAAGEARAARGVEGNLAREEAAREAARLREKALRDSSRQRLAFLKSGVSIEGSPLLVTQQTLDFGLEGAEAVRKRGVAQQRLLEQQGRIIGRQGRANLLSGVARDAQTASSLFPVSNSNNSRSRAKAE